MGGNGYLFVYYYKVFHNSVLLLTSEKFICVLWLTLFEVPEKTIKSAYQMLLRQSRICVFTQLAPVAVFCVSYAYFHAVWCNFVVLFDKKLYCLCFLVLKNCFMYVTVDRVCVLRSVYVCLSELGQPPPVL